MANRQEAAETLALDALGWLAADEGRLAGFLAAAGIAPRDLGARAAQPEVLAAVLDHILGDEAAVLGAARDLGIPPAAFARARAVLPGGDVPHWT